MRLEMTHTEDLLWRQISNRKLGGLKFRAQHPVGRFIFDFYCPEHKLAVEIDGSSHIHRSDNDKVHDREVESFGYRVIRFTTREVEEEIEVVLRRILRFALNKEASAGMRNP
jgi:very-short-patch-repair endonuclease